MYAVIRTGGKQYRVQEKETIVIEKIPGSVGESVTLDEVLFVGGATPRFGAPTVAGASVTGTILRQARGKKVNGLTYIKVKNHHRRYGHRQEETHLRIDTIAG